VNQGVAGSEKGELFEVMRHSFLANYIKNGYSLLKLLLKGTQNEAQFPNVTAVSYYPRPPHWGPRRNVFHWYPQLARTPHTLEQLSSSHHPSINPEQCNRSVVCIYRGQLKARRSDGRRSDQTSARIIGQSQPPSVPIHFFLYVLYFFLYRGERRRRGASHAAWFNTCTGGRGQ
jgi:hypothetical protein